MPVDPDVFLKKMSGSEVAYRRRLTRQALEEQGPTPKVLWGYIRYHLDFWRWKQPRKTVEVEPTRLREVIGLALDSRDEVEDESLCRAIERVARVAAATFDLEDEPDEETLERATEWLDRFKALNDEPFEEYEDWMPAERYSEARARVRAWEAVRADHLAPDERFGFIAEYIYPNDLQWAMDPLVMLPEFREWATREIVERNVTQPRGEYLGFRPDMYVRWNKTRPSKEIKALNMGRLLAAQLSGLDVTEVGRMMISSKEGVAPLVQQLIESGLDPNHFESGKALLHSAARAGDEKVVKVLLDAGADPTVTRSAGETPLDLAKRKKVKQLLASAMDEFEVPTNDAQPEVLTGFDEWSGFGELSYDELSGDVRLEALSDGYFHCEDVFGGQPEVVHQHSGDLQWTRDLQLHPDGYGYLVVDGDLEVDGVVVFRATDLANVMVVNGDLTARALVLSEEANLYVRGRTKVQECILLQLSDGGFARFVGPVEADSVISLDEESFRFDSNTPEQLGTDDLLNELLEEGHYPDMEKIIEDVEAGEAVVKG